MAWIEVEQKAIAKRQSTAGRAFGGKGQHGISGPGMIIDHQRRRDQPAQEALAGKGQMPEGIGFDLPLLRLNLAPGDRPVLVGIEPDRDIEVAQRNVPLAADHAGGVGLDPQIAVGRKVCARAVRGREQRER